MSTPFSICFGQRSSIEAEWEKKENKSGSRIINMCEHIAQAIKQILLNHI